jgi:hypothetical protein
MLACFLMHSYQVKFRKVKERGVRGFIYGRRFSKRRNLLSN